jgi:hypothetical protein
VAVLGRSIGGRRGAQVGQIKKMSPKWLIGLEACGVNDEKIVMGCVVFGPEQKRNRKIGFQICGDWFEWIQKDI